MIKKLKTMVMIAFASFALLTPALAVPALGGVAAAAPASNITGGFCEGSKAASGGDCTATSTNNADNTLTTLAQTITRWFSIIVGAISIIMIIFGGFRYITSGGDSGKVGAAKNTLIYAIVGLIVVALAQVIVNFVLTQSNSAVQ